MKRKLGIFFIILILFSTFSPIVDSQIISNIPVLSINNFSSTQGDILTAPITLQNAEDIIGAYILLEYDPTILEVIRLSNSDFNTESYKNIDNVNGVIGLGLVNTEPIGLQGDINFIDVQFKVIGGFNSESDLKITARSIQNIENKEIPRTTKDGKISINSAYDSGIHYQKTPENTITYTYGVQTYKRHDGVIRPKKELNLNNGDYPYLLTGNQIQKDGVILTLPSQKDLTYKHIITGNKAKIKPIFTFNSYDPDNFIKNNNSSGYITLPWSSNSNYQIKGEFITTGPFTWDSGIRIIDSNHSELSKANYSIELSGNNIKLTQHNNSFFENAVYPVKIEFDSWTVGLGGDPWGGNVTHDNTTVVQATGNVELQQLVHDYVSYWRFDNDSTLDENTTNNNNGINNGATYNITGYYGGAFEFDGTNDYINYGNDESSNITGELTIETWVQSTNTVSYPRIIAKGSPSAAANLQGYQLYWSGAVAYFNLGNGADTGIRVSFGNVFDGNWHHIAGTWDGITMKTYTDGVYQDQDTYTGTPTTTENLHVAASSLPSYYFEGSIDEVRIFDYALSPSEINQTRYNEHYETGNLSSIIIHSGNGLKWQNIGFNATIPGNTSVDIYVNTSSDNSTWSGPQLIQSNASGDGTIYPIPSEYQGNYTQWILTLHQDSYNQPVSDHFTPAIENVTLGLEVLTTPEITNVTSTPSTTSSLIVWDVNQTTNNRVEYGLTTDLGSWSVWDNNTSTPEITISGLTVNTTYYYSVWSHHINDSSISINSSIYNFTTSNYPYIINWSNNNTNNQNLTIYSNLGDFIHFNVSANQNITAWTWNVDSVNYSQGFDNITLSFNSNTIYEVAAFGINENGTTNVITWTIVIGDIQILIYRQNQAIIEEERMMGLSILLTMLIFVGIVFFLLGILMPNSILTMLGSITFFVTMLLPIPVLENYSYFGIALTLILLMFGVIGIIITFYQWFTIYTEQNSFRKWDENF